MGTFWIGREIANGYSKGTIDDVRIYNRALSAQEVKQLFEQGQVNVAHSNTVSLSSGLVGYWTFDGKVTHWDTGKTDDVSGNGNTGTLLGMSTTTSPTPGKIGQALKFNGTSQYINVPYNSAFVSTKITVSFWMKTSQAINTTFINVLTRGYDGSVSPWSFDFRNDLPGSGSCSGNNCYLDFINFPGGTTHGCLGTKDFNLDTTNIGKWYFFTGTFDGSTYRLYFNGVQNCSSSDSTALATNTKGLNIAYLDVNGSPGRLFPGTIDDVRLYNRMLSYREIQQLYAMGGDKIAHSNTAALTNGLVGHWPLNGPATSWKTNTTQDTSGNGNTGTMVGMSTTTSPVAGKIGQALKFNSVSSQYVDAPSLASLSGVSKYTMSAWMKRSTVRGIGGFVSQFTDTSHVVDLEQWNDGNVYASVSTSVIDGHFASNDTSWHFYSAVYDGTQTGNSNRLKIYMDGVQQTLTFDGTIPATIPTISGDFFIGKTVGPNNTTGTIDDVRVYNRALSYLKFSSSG